MEIFFLILFLLGMEHIALYFYIRTMKEERNRLLSDYERMRDILFREASATMRKVEKEP